MTVPERKNIILSRVVGGLGNQLFQYAFGFALARRTQAQLVLDARAFGNYHVHKLNLSALRISAPILYSRKVSLSNALLTYPLRRRLRQLPQFQEPAFEFRADNLKQKAPLCISGYFQSPRYFSDYEQELKESLRLKNPLSKKAADYATRIEQPNTVCLHVRRGDYVSNKAALAVHGTLQPDYYLQAWQHLKMPKDTEVFFFSDDLDWAMENIQIDAKRIPVDCGGVAHPEEDLCLMSKASHHIVANSTFSWWAAWLGKKTNQKVIVPKNWFVSPDHDTKDLFLPDWITL